MPTVAVAVTLQSVRGHYDIPVPAGWMNPVRPLPDRRAPCGNTLCLESSVARAVQPHRPIHVHVAVIHVHTSL